MALRDRLRRATRDPHDALEASPFFEAMSGEGFSLPQYVAWLRVMAVVVDTLEHELDRADEPRVVALWHESMRKRPGLRSDLAALDEVPAQPSAAIEPLIALVERWRGWGRDEPLRLVGPLYVLEGSTLGGRILRERLIARLGADAPGLAYVTAYGANTGRSWASFRRRLDALELTDDEAEQIVDAARSVFAAMGELVAELHDVREHAVVQALNFDAGPYAVTYDPRELVAAIDAGVRTWDEYPYYAMRYGLRGRRFTRSDSAWLVTLADEVEAARRKHLDWLARLLVSRGMPTLLLEEHLWHLHQALVAAVPERAERYAGLETAALRLRDQRLEALPEFDEIAASLPAGAVPNLGPVVAGALADERRELPGASETLAWLTEPRRASAKWISAVRRVVDRIR